MSIEFTFLIFLAVIVVMVVVTLVIKFAFSGNMLFCKIAGTCNKDAPPVPDNQVISLTSINDCTRVRTEIVKHAKLCYERWLELASNEVSICYTILSRGGCPASMQNDVNADLVTEGVNGSMYANPADTKMVVTFHRKDRSIAII